MKINREQWGLSDIRIGGIQILPDGRIISCQGPTIDLWDPIKKSYQDIRENPIDNDINIMCLAILHDGRLALPRYVSKFLKGRAEWPGDHNNLGLIDNAICGSHPGNDFTLIGIYDNNKNYAHMQSIGPISCDNKMITSLLTLQDGRLASACAGVIQIKSNFWNSTKKVSKVISPLNWN